MPKKPYREAPKRGTKPHIITRPPRKYLIKEIGPKQAEIVTKKAQKRITEAALLGKISSAKKGSYTAKYNRELEKVMREKGYFQEGIDRAKKYSLTGKAVKIAIAKIPLSNINMEKMEFFVEGKGWMKEKAYQSMVRSIVYWAKVKHYQALFNISLLEAQELYEDLRGEFGERIRKAIY